MKCPYCNYTESKVVDSRAIEVSTSIRRRRECLSCGERFTTYERIEELPLTVRKRGNSQEFFDKNKLLTGILKACEKRPVNRKDLEDIVKDIEHDFRNRMETEIKSEEIGQMVMERLRHIDEVAYVRFASVYRQFKDIKIFKEELEKLLDS
ncbi:MAG: transcriptional repressor NrdR [Halanaerobiales bacterium]|nr:transcriptional repressor NrdR [Halanaerobiales bacterium]